MGEIIDTIEDEEGVYSAPFVKSDEEFDKLLVPVLCRECAKPFLPIEDFDETCYDCVQKYYADPEGDWLLSRLDD